MGRELGSGRWGRGGRCVSSVAVAAAVLLAARVVSAHGLGVHVAGGRGDAGHRQVGLTWDTAAARDRAFNYRLSVAHEAFSLDRDGWTEHLSGTLVENTFGLRLAAGPHARTWLGPQVLAAAYGGELGLGVGVALGVNWHVAEAVSLGLTGGVRAMEYSDVFSSDETETVGYLRVDLLWRTPGDRPPRGRVASSAEERGDSGGTR